MPIPWVTVSLLAVLAVAGIAGWRLLGRPAAPAAPTTATTYWMIGWVCALLSGALSQLYVPYSALAVLAHPFGVLFAGFVLCGALRFADRPCPRGLLAALLAIGALRALLQLQGHGAAVWTLALVVDPLLMGAGAWVVYDAVRRRAPTLPQRLLVPTLALLAGVELGTNLWVALGGDVSQTLIVTWIGAAAVIMGIQIQAGSDHAWQKLEGERERTERALRESEERHRTISEIASDFSFKFRIDPELRLERAWVVGAFERITGYPPSVLDGHGWLGFLLPEVREGVEEEFRAATSGAPFLQERSIVAAGGEIRWLAIRLAAVRSEQDGSLEVVGSASDITERRRLEEHVQEVQRLESLGIMAGGIAHDFNNLLTVIRGHARLAWSDLPDDSPARRRLEQIEVAASHAADLTDRMLTYAGKSSATFEPVDLNRMTEAMEELLQATVHDRCALCFDLAPDLPAVEGDPRALRQVLLNLVQNACDAFDGDGGSVRIRTFAAEPDESVRQRSFGAPDPQPGRYVVVEVHDDGAGMDATTARRIFEPFFTTKFSGRGLGMAAVLGIVRAHGGFIDLESEPGQGTRVRVHLPPAETRRAAVTLPRAEPAAADDAAEGRRVARATNAEPVARHGKADDGPLGPRVLVVDDDPSVLDLAREFLERAGFRVVTAAGGREAVETLRQLRDIEVAVLDLTMPDLDGETTCRKLREVRADLPVVRVSGYDAGPAGRATGRGRDAFVRKPFAPEELVKAVREIGPH